MHPEILNHSSYLIMALVALLSTIPIGLTYSRFKPLSFSSYMVMVDIMAIGAVIGARLLSVFTRPGPVDYFAISTYMEGGLVYYGGLLGSLGFAFLCQKMAHYNASYIFDHMTFMIPFTHCLGRIGCFLVGCCWGMPYDGPFAVVFPEGAKAPAGVLY